MIPLRLPSARLAALLLAVLAGFLAGTPAAAKRPNVLLIVTDDQGYGDFGFTGNRQIETPNLDRFAAGGIRFERFYVTPFCAPTRAALLTGRYPLRGGVHGVSRGEETMRSDETTLAELLRKAGYRTGLFGKWHNGENYPYTPNGQGFEEALGFNLGHWNNYFDPRLRHNAEWVTKKGWISDVLTEEAAAFIEQHRSEPWFCYLSYNAPHSPFQCPDREFDKYKAKGLDDTLASIYGMCENIDTNIGALIAKLEEWQLRENTIVLFATDNGPAGDTRYTAGLRGKKGTLYEGGSRTPLLLQWPARFKEPRVVPTLAHAIDVLPTVAELIGMKPKTTFPLDGRSLVPLLGGEKPAWPEREIFIQNYARQDLQRTQGCVVTQRFAAVNPGRGWELYDLEKDPGQQTNLAGTSGDARMILDDLSAKFERWWSQTSAGVTVDRPPVPVGHAAEPLVEASAAQAELLGELKYCNKAPNNAWITGWENGEAHAVWTVQASAPGAYELGIAFTRDQSAPPLKLRAETGGLAIEANVPHIPARARPMPDRVPRKEAADMEWQNLPIGRVNLVGGEQTISVRLTAPDASFALKTLTLRANP